MHSRSSDSPNLETDPLVAVISLLRPQMVLSKVISGAGRWSVRYAAQEHPGFCLMLERTSFLDVDGAGVIKLEQGDFVLLPATPGFTMSSDRGMRPKVITPSHRNELRHGTQSGPPSTILGDARPAEENGKTRPCERSTTPIPVSRDASNADEKRGEASAPSRATGASSEPRFTVGSSALHSRFRNLPVPHA